MKKIFLSILILTLILAAPCYAAESGDNYEIYESAINAMFAHGQMVQNKRTFLLNKRTGEAFMYLNDKWVLVERSATPLGGGAPVTNNGQKEVQEQ